MILRLFVQFAAVLILASQIVADYQFVNLENSWTDVNQSISELKISIGNLVNSSLKTIQELEDLNQKHLENVKIYYKVMINYMENTTLSQIDNYKKEAHNKNINIDECLKNVTNFKDLPEKTLTKIDECLDILADPLKNIRMEVQNITNEIPPLYKHLVMCGQVDENCIKKVAKEVEDTKKTLTKEAENFITQANEVTDIYQSFLFQTCGDKNYNELLIEVSEEFKVTADCIDEKLNHFG